MIELYGYLDLETRDWIDGLFSKIFREINKDTNSAQNARRYICFDGDVDALWIENMNSVMDDNKLLTLANGERIRLGSHCALLFEVGDLAYASPATVSRTGMVFVDPKNLGYEPYWQRWISSRSDQEREILDELYERLIPETSAFVHEGIDGSTQNEPLKTIVPQTELNMIIQMCIMLDATLPSTTGKSKATIDKEVIECVFLQCLYLSFGASLIDDSRHKFDEFIKRLNPLMSIQDSPDKPANTSQWPSAKSTLYEYFFDIEKKEWIAWEWTLSEYVHEPKTKFSDILVPTVDTTRTDWLLQLMKQVIQFARIGSS